MRALRLDGSWFLATGLVVLFLGGCSGSGGGSDVPIAPAEGGASTGGGSGEDGGSPSGTGGNSLGLDPTQNPCAGENPPEELCRLEVEPACGDAEINQDSEACDDGNTLPGDGCNGICVVEANYRCTTAGQPCELVFACGNGAVEPGEVCDDGNTLGGDGCSETCEEVSLNFFCILPGEPCKRIVDCGDGRIGGDETCEDDQVIGSLQSGDGCDTECHVEIGWICRVPGQPCERAPMCGDGIVTPSINEACDDGNTEGGDGCAADCSFAEDGWLCASPGQPCQDLTVCGDGLVTGSEECDDADDDPEDGCDACALTEGWECPFPGAPCLPECGDGINLNGAEICDDANLEDGDGCSSLCEWEDGWACSGTAPDYQCERTVCGDGVRAGTESCDDGNSDMGDGCTPLCHVEPSCDAGACTSTCGDGLRLGLEACDDGNNRSGDGCSSGCEVEPGSECEQPELGENMNVPVVYRDFDGTHPDFEPGATGCEIATLGLVAATLDPAGKPVQASTGADLCGQVSALNDWYRDTAASTTVVSTMTLWNTGTGSFVNRWSEEGQQWSKANPDDIQWCADAGGSCDECTFDYVWCHEPCVEWGAGSTQICALGAGGIITYEGDPTFFPLDGQGQTPTAQYVEATIPQPVYEGNWQVDPSGELHNFHFTSEVRFWFQFDANLEQSLEFTGDDDVWVFINNRLAVDLGGIHVPVSGLVDVAQQALALGLVDGEVYEIVVFQAERQTNGSSYRLTLSGFNAAPSECGPICGDGIVSPGEQCDDGENLGGYGNCNADCTRGEYCGDGIPQLEAGEQCDNGDNRSPYGASGCAPGCRAVPYCGDGAVQSAYGERCDDGINDGSYGGCTSDCQRAGYCGDGVPDAGEECDDGLNNGAYGTCGPDCILGPRCGDNVLQTEWGETCDDGNNEPSDGCSPLCGEEGICGDSLPNPESGEQCDDGVNDGGYGECGPNCLYGPRCGDGVTQPEEEACDGGPDARVAYGECAPNCILGPHCGDGDLDIGYEDCDDGNTNNKDGCSSACKIEIIIPI